MLKEIIFYNATQNTCFHFLFKYTNLLHIIMFPNDINNHYHFHFHHHHRIDVHIKADQFLFSSSVHIILPLTIQVV